MLMCGLDASSTAPAMVDPNEVPTEPAVVTHDSPSVSERGHDVLDDQVAGSEQRGDAQAGQDLHDAEDQEIAHHHAEHHIADGEQRQEHDHMPPVRAFHLPGTEDDRPDAGADREHGELQAEEPLRAGGLHRGRHGHVECGEAHVEHHEHDQQWQNAPIRQYIARLGGIGPVQTTQPETVVFGEGVGAAWSPAVWSAGAG